MIKEKRGKNTKNKRRNDSIINVLAIHSEIQTNKNLMLRHLLRINTCLKKKTEKYMSILLFQQDIY